MSEQIWTEVISQLICVLFHSCFSVQQRVFLPPRFPPPPPSLLLFPLRVLWVPLMESWSARQGSSYLGEESS